MPIEALENLEKIGQLKAEDPRGDEIEGLRASGLDRLEDANNEELSYASRFDLAYNAGHALALCALRKRGYRADSRYIVFQVLPHTVGLTDWRILDKAHNQRNLAEYEGHQNEDWQLLEDMLKVVQMLADSI